MITYFSRDKDHRQGGRSGEDSSRVVQRERPFTGSGNIISDRSNFDQKAINGSQTSSMSRQSCGIFKISSTHISS